MYKLYYSPSACSMAVHVILNEIGADYELQKTVISNGDTKKPEFLKLNPNGAIPLLLIDGQPIFEGAAQIAYLCDTHNSPLMAKAGLERAQALQWLMFCNSTLHTAYSRAGWAAKKVKMSNEEARKEITEQACDSVQTMWDRVEAHLTKTGQPYLVGKQPTAADILMTVIANWGFLPRQFNFGPKTKVLLKAISTRPAYQQALATEQVEYKAAA